MGYWRYLGTTLGRALGRGSNWGGIASMSIGLGFLLYGGPAGHQFNVTVSPLAQYVVAVVAVIILVILWIREGHKLYRGESNRADEVQTVLINLQDTRERKRQQQKELGNLLAEANGIHQDIASITLQGQEAEQTAMDWYLKACGVIEEYFGSAQVEVFKTIRSSTFVYQGNPDRSRRLTFLDEKIDALRELISQP